MPLRLRGVYRLAIVLGVAGLLALLVDLQVAQFCREGRVPGPLGRLLDLSEFFGHGGGVAMIVAAALVLDQTNRKGMVRLLGCAYGAGLVADLFKLVVDRTRPRLYSVLPAHVSETFHDWATFLVAADWSQLLEDGSWSFPSAHAAMAMGLAIGLARLYPQGRWLFGVFAAMAAMQRVDTGMHYLSDALAGAALGCWIAALCVDPRAIGRWFDAWEGRSALAEPVPGRAAPGRPARRRERGPTRAA